MNTENMNNETVPTAAAGKLVVIIPAFNEQITIGGVISSIPRHIPGINSIEVVVVDDGSSDGTVEIANSCGVVVVSHERNRGVGAAFHSGLREALKRGASIIVNIDADGQFNSEDIPKLIEPIQKRQVDFVTTTRFADTGKIPAMPPVKIWGNRFMTKLINFIAKKKFTDVSCGFRAYSREAALRLTLFGNFTYTQETFIDLAFKNVRMTEVPLLVRGVRKHGHSRVADNLWRYGLKTATIIFRAARDYRPQYFFGLPGLIIFVAGIAGGMFLLQHFIRFSQTYPYRSLVQLSSVLVIVGFLMMTLSLLADMLHRNRVVIEEAVYHLRKAAYETKAPKNKLYK